MRKILLALSATAGVIGFASLGASAAPLASVHMPQASSVQQAGYYCGPRCQYWHHRRWEARHDSRWHHHYPYYSYNNGYGYYYR
jgi:hypothetical protein